MKFKLKYSAFTLAEILITLVIIGIVAALTIPNIITSYKKHQTEVKVKKAFNMLSEAFNMAQAEYGNTENWDIPNKTTWANKYLFPFLKGVENYTYKNHFYTQCMKPEAGNGCERKSKKSYNFLTSDGVGLDIIWAGDGSSAYYYPLFISISFDINGNQEPNIFGKDIFVFNYYLKSYAITKRKKGYNSSGHTCHGVDCKYDFIIQHSGRQQLINYCKQSALNTYCLDLILNNNWKISDDYPW